MTKQKFLREGVRGRQLEGAHREQSWTGPADSQSLLLARTSPPGRAASPCIGTKDSVDKGLQEPPAPTSAPGPWFLSGSDATFGALDQQLGLHLSTSTSRGTQLEGRREALAQGRWVQADTPSLCSTHPHGPQPFTHHNQQSVLYSWAMVYGELHLHCLCHGTEMSGAAQRLQSVRALQ